MHSKTTKLCSALLLSLTLSACGTTLPGLDRIFFSNSSANVGPLVSSDEEYPATEPVIKAEQEVQQIEDSLPPSVEASAGGDLVSAEQNENEATTRSEEIQKQGEIRSDRKASDSSVSKQVEPVEIAVEYGSVRGKVALIGDDGEVLSSEGTMITLKPQTLLNEAQNQPSEVHVIDMENKTYLPRYSTIRTGDQLVFVNKDNIRHNVFSTSGKNAFDLGTYGAGLKRAVTLKESGVVKIYCNIHPEMATFVAVGDQGLSVRVDDSGNYSVENVLPGSYEATIWNIRGESKRMVVVKPNETLELYDRIDTSEFEIEPHKNKFGGNYSKNSELFEDEFY